MCCLKDGIALQFACKYNEASAEDVHIAHSKTSRELRATDTVNKVSILNCPDSTDPFLTILIAIIDYKGFRIIAHADMSHLKVDFKIM
jgi:hypothetical protein